MMVVMTPSELMVMVMMMVPAVVLSELATSRMHLSQTSIIGF